MQNYESQGNKNVSEQPTKHGRSEEICPIVRGADESYPHNEKAYTSFIYGTYDPVV